MHCVLYILIDPLDSALRRVTTFVSDGVYVINPARFDPVKSTAASFGQSPNKVISLPGKPMQVSRAICMSLGYVFTCNVVYPTMFGKQQAQMVKSILFGPMRAEWERSISFFGTVFGVQEMSVNTFSASSQYIGINVRTFPSEPASTCESYFVRFDITY